MAIETLHVRQSLIPGLSAGDLEQRSFYELLEDRYGIVIVGGHADDRADGDQRGGVGRARRAAALAGVPVRAHDTHSATGEIVEYVRSIYRGDRYRLVTELNRRASRPSRRNG